jgi:hypothetical protein
MQLPFQRLCDLADGRALRPPQHAFELPELSFWRSDGLIRLPAGLGASPDGLS